MKSDFYKQSLYSYLPVDLAPGESTRLRSEAIVATDCAENVIVRINFMDRVSKEYQFTPIRAETKSVNVTYGAHSSPPEPGEK